MRPPKTLEQATADLIAKTRRELEECKSECSQLKADVSADRRNLDICKGDRLRFEEELRKREASSFSAAVKQLGQRWLTDNVPSQIENRPIDDPIYGHIVLDEALATIASHPLVHRLARIKQLSFSYAQFPSARHSRLSHTLGVVKNAERALNGILDRGVYYVIGGKDPVNFSEQITSRRHELVQKAQLVALLHDIGHGPFGHALDIYAGIQLRTDYPDKYYTEVYVERFLAETLKSLGYAAASVLPILSSNRVKLKGIDNLIGDIVDSSLDVDRMDYLMRDAHMTGLMMGFINTSALIDFMRPVLEGESFILAYDKDALSYMEHLILARDFMYINCYEHAKKKAAERILTRLVKSIVDDPRLGISLDEMFSLTDEELTTLVTGVGTGNGMVQHLGEELMGNLDYVCVFVAPATTKDGTALPSVVETWLRDVVMGADQKKGYDRKKNAYIARPSQWEEEIAVNSIGAERVWQIQVILPDPKSYQPPQSATTLLTRNGAGEFQKESFFTASRVVKNIVDSLNLRRQTISVLCPAALPRAERDEIRKAAEALFAFN